MEYNAGSLRRINLEQLLTTSARAMLAAVKEAGGRPWLVGGCVRDALLGLPSKDIDLEVYGLAAGRLREVLEQHGRVFAVGVSFGVLKVYLSDGSELDVALPRRDSYKGERGFVSQATSDINLLEAAARRDFTINAMAIDPFSGELLDFYGGQADLKAGILRHTGPAFVEDPLRVLRAMQFAARWEFRLAPETARLCASLRPEYTSLPRDRIWGEWHKLVGKGVRPSSGLAVLEQTGWRSLYPALENLANRPEASGWQATLQASDRASLICQRDGLDGPARLVVMLATLCHDLGRSATTESTGQAQTGLASADQFLTGIGCPHHLSDKVLALVSEPLREVVAPPDPASVRHLAYRLRPATIEQWERVTEAVQPLRPGLEWLELARKLRCADRSVEPLLQGRHLQEAKLKPGPRYRAILEAALVAQLDGVFDNLEEAKVWLAAQFEAGPPD